MKFKPLTRQQLETLRDDDGIAVFEPDTWQVACTALYYLDLLCDATIRAERLEREIQDSNSEEENK